jgi:hypothetical protein
MRYFGFLAKDKERGEHYRLLLIKEHDFAEIQVELKNIAWHLGKKRGDIVPLFIPKKVIEEVQSIIGGDKITLTPDLDMSFSGSNIKAIYKDFYERAIKKELSEVYIKIKDASLEVWNNKERIDYEINILLFKIIKLSQQFELPEYFLEATIDEEFDKSLAQICSELRIFKEMRR